MSRRTVATVLGAALLPLLSGVPSFAQDEKETVITDVPTLRKDLTEARKELRDIRLMLEQAFQGVQTDIQALTKGLEQQKDVSSRMDGRLVAAEEQLKQAQGSINSLEAELQELKKRLPAPPAPEPAEPARARELARRVEDLERWRDSRMETEIALQQAQGQMKQMLDALTAMQRDLDDLRGKVTKTDATLSLYPPLDRQSVEEMREKLSRLEATVGTLQNGSVTTRSSPAANNLGRIIVVNGTGEELLFLLNGQASRVGPNTQLPLENRPAGTFSYEIISPNHGRLRANSPTLNPGATYTITIQ